MCSRLFNIHCILFLDVWPRTFILVLRPPRRRGEICEVKCGRSRESRVWPARRLVALLPSSRALLNKSY